MNAFVLGTGRCGSVTFARACSHLDNFTTGHESRADLVGADRFAFPNHHIEVDNRLSWFLGELGRRFDDRDVLFVHLLRDADEVTESFTRRWDSPYRAGIIKAFSHGIIMRSSDWDRESIRSVCEFYVSTVTANIEEFLRSRRSITVDISEGASAFAAFAAAIGATGDIESATNEFSVRHNAGD